MKRRQKMRWYLFGMLSAILVVQLLTPALALFQQTIQVYSGLDVYVDDMKLDPKDANGKSVEVFAYNGTTYLPIRAISGALGYPIQYDGATASVYVGKHTSDTPAAYLSQMDYFYGSTSISTAGSEMDNLGTTHTNCITRSFDRTYLINGQYTKISGTLYQTYDDRSETIRKNCGINIYGDGRLLYSYSPEMGTQGLRPVSFSVDLTGVLELEVEFDSVTYSGAYDRHAISLGEVGLWT